MTNEQLWAEMYSPEFRRMWEAAVQVESGAYATPDLFRLHHGRGYWPTICLRTMYLLKHHAHISDAELTALVEQEQEGRWHKKAARGPAPSDGTDRAANTAKLLAMLGGGSNG